MTQRTTRNSWRAAGLEDLFTFLDPSGNQSQEPHSIPSTNSSRHVITTWICTHWNFDETPDETLGTTNHEAEAFAKAIDKIVKANYVSSKSKPKLREPDPFDGSDSRKLRTFILQCKLNFQDRPDFNFQDDNYQGQLHFVPSEGFHFNCFKTRTIGSKLNYMVFGPQPFHQGTRNNFRTYDPVGKAEAELEGLRMHESHQATKYFIKFQQLATCVQWARQALHQTGLQWTHQMYQRWHGPPQKPNTLSSLWKIVQAIDAQYWERHGEVSCETHASEPQKQNWTEVWLFQVWQNVSKFFAVQAEEQSLRLYPEQGSTSNRRSPPLPTFPWNSGKTES